jgi:hypothetical protein
LSGLYVIDNCRRIIPLARDQNELLKDTDIADRVAEQQEQLTLGLRCRREAFLC